MITCCIVWYQLSIAFFDRVEMSTFSNVGNIVPLTNDIFSILCFCIFYSNPQNYKQYPSALNQPMQSRWLTHKSAFTFDHSFSIGFISGLYGGRYRSSMPAAWYVLFVLAVQQLLSTLHCATFYPFFSSPCDTLYHFLLQLSRVTAILEVAISRYRLFFCDACHFCFLLFWLLIIFFSQADYTWFCMKIRAASTHLWQ